MHSTFEEGRVSFRCRDLEHDCPFHVSGEFEEEIFPKIEHHGREHHGVISLDEADEKKIRAAIRHREAA